jgi:hypothetical protein
MQLVGPAFYQQPRLFGRRRVPARQVLAAGGDLKLFAATFLVGFVFVSILIG